MRLLVAGCLVAASSFAWASDHTNLDEARPMRFEDAYPLAFGAKEIQVGMRASFLRRERSQYAFRMELKQGIGFNRHVEIGIDPTVGRDASTGFDASYFQQLRSESANLGAMAFRVDLASEQGRQGGRLRGIYSRSLGNQDHLHLNLDANFLFAPRGDERGHFGSAILGFSRTVSLTQTVLVQLAFDQDSVRGTGTSTSAGIGIRNQVGKRSVLDLGLETDLHTGRASVTAGYTFNF